MQGDCILSMKIVTRNDQVATMEERIQNLLFETIVKDLVAGKVFKHQPGRKGYNSFKNLKKDIIGSDYHDFFT
jgi:hypothetical protein